MTTINPYDAVPYTSHIFKHSHPSQMATIATLFGLHPPSVENCKVLELGCASGTNLIAMAQGFPHSEFIGIDLSARQIQEGQERIRQMGTQNVSVKQMSILEVTPQFGKFDYIIAHGIYSWVPPAVQEKILQICRDNLTPNGLAYISYNVYPGWYTQQLFREMMLFHTQSTKDPVAKINQAKECLQLLQHLLQSEGETPYRQHLQPVLERLNKSTEDYLFHEHLEEYNQPLFFYQFVEQASRYGLHYVADTDGIALMFADTFPPKTAELLKQFDNQIHLEQYIDFLVNRMFRKTLLGLQPVPVTRLVAQEMTRFYIAGQFIPSATSNSNASAPLEFTHVPSGTRVPILSPVAKAICLSLGNVWPRSLSFQMLLYEIARHLSDESVKMSHNDIVNNTAYGLLGLYKRGILELQLYPLPLTITVTERPQTMPLVRWYAQRRLMVTNVYHQPYTFGALESYILSLLDGHHNREQLANLVLQKINQGDFEISRNVPDQPPQPITNPLEKFIAVAKIIDDALALFAKMAFLVG